MTTGHPTWCSALRCTAENPMGGHESEPLRVSTGRGQLRLLMVLRQRPARPVRVRLVTMSDLMVSTLDLDLDTAHLARANLDLVLSLAAAPPPST